MGNENLDFKDIANPITDTHAFDNISSWEALLINSSLMVFKDIFDRQMSSGCDCPSDHMAEEYTFGTLTNRYLRAVGKVPIPETILRGIFGDVVKEPPPMVFPSVEISSPEELQMFHDAILDKRTEWFEHMAKCSKGHDTMFRASLNLCEKHDLFALYHLVSAKNYKRTKHFSPKSAPESYLYQSNVTSL